MAGIFETEANKYLNQAFQYSEHPGYSSLYFALLSSAPTKAMDGSDVAGIEVSYTSYARVEVTVGAASFEAGSGGASQNSITITFPICSGGTATATHWAILDGVAGTDDDDPIFFGELDSSLSISINDAPRFFTGAFDIEMGTGIFDEEANRYLDKVLRGTALPSYDSTMYLMLLTSLPTKDMDYSALRAIETTYTACDYAEVHSSSWGCTGDSYFDSPSGGETTTDTVIQFNTCTGGTSTITHWALVGAEGGVPAMLYGALDPSLSIYSGIIMPEIPIGGFTIAIT